MTRGFVPENRKNKEVSETLRQPAYLTEYSINDFFTINAYENMESAGYALYFLKK